MHADADILGRARWSRFEPLIAVGTCELGRALPFQRGYIDDVIPNTDHHIAVLNIDL